MDQQTRTARRAGAAVALAALALCGTPGTASAATLGHPAKHAGSASPAAGGSLRAAQARAAVAAAAVARQARQHGKGHRKASPTPTPVPTVSASPAPTVVPSPVPSPSDGVPTPVDPTATPTPTADPTPTPTDGPTPVVEPTPSTPAVAAPTVGPHTYYVDPAGDDTADGLSPATALRTLDAVNALDLAPGDAVRLKGGATFHGGLLLDAADAGAADAPVVIGSYDGRATIDAGTGSGIVVRDAGGVRVEGLDVVGSGQVGAGLLGDGVLFYTDLDGGVSLPAVAVSDVDVSGFGNAGVEVGAWSPSWSGYAATTVSSVTAHGNGDAGISTFGFLQPGSTQHSLTDVTVESSTAYGNRGLAGKGTDSGSGIDLGGTDGGSVRGCETYDNGADNDAPTGPAGILVWESTHVQVSDDDSHDNRSSSVGGAGIAFAGGVSASSVTGDVTSGNSGPGLLVQQPEGFGATAGNALVRNVSSDDGRRDGAGIELSGAAGGTGVQDTDVYLNTVSTSGVAGRVASALRVRGLIRTAELHDNGFVARRGTALLDVDHALGQLRFVRNTYTGSAGGFLVLWDGTRYLSLQSWRAATGQEAPTGAV